MHFNMKIWFIIPQRLQLELNKLFIQNMYRQTCFSRVYLSFALANLFFVVEIVHNQRNWPLNF